MLERPQVNEGQWIRIGNLKAGSVVSGLVMAVLEDHIAVGYYQNQSKAIKEDVIWKDGHWQFKYQGPNGSYLHGSEEAAVKRGPPPKS